MAARLEEYDADAPPADLEQYSYYDLVGWAGDDAHAEWNRALKDLGQKTGRDLAPPITRTFFGGAKLGEQPLVPEPVAARADLLEDLRSTWATLDRTDAALVAKFLAHIRATVTASGLEFEVAHQLDQLSSPSSAPQTERSTPAAPQSPKEFRDPWDIVGDAPAMIEVPAGAFVMGSPPDEPERRNEEGPQHRVRFDKPFALGKFAVSFKEFDLFCDHTGYERPEDEGWGRGGRPVIKVSWEDARKYCAWLSEQSGAEYRLPSEAEWEYACRAGTATPFWWGREVTPDQANYNGDHVYAGGGSKGAYREKTEPVDAFEPNPFGLHQMHGNVWEWCADAWNESYRGAPDDGAAWMSGDSSRAVLRGGSWISYPWSLRSAYRSGYPRVLRGRYYGFRVARTIISP